MIKLEKYINENFGFEESKEIKNLFDKHKLYSEIEYLVNEVIDQKEDDFNDKIEELDGEFEDLKDSIDEPKEEKELLEISIKNAKEILSKIGELINDNLDATSLLEDALSELEG